MDQDINKYKSALKNASKKINELSDQLKKINEKEEIAIIGYSCRFPGGANNPDAFWDILENGIDTVTEIKESRFDKDHYYNENMDKPGKMYTKHAAFLDIPIGEFDNAHFEISAIESSSIDPQQRLLLEVSWESLENAGVNIEKLKGSKTGVFIGMNSLDYAKAEMLSGNVDDINPYSTTGTSFNAASGRIAYFYDLKGPAVSYDTACSSSIVALNGAVQSLRNGDCDLAIVGGVNLLLSPESFIGLSKTHGLSKDGRCKAFDASADGFGRGEGCGVVILKRLQDAKRDKNNIDAIVTSVFVGQDGKTNGFTAPNGISQKNVIMQTLKQANLTANDIDYIETHGTGTELGDFIEAQAISSLPRDGSILIGSAKSNIAHLEAASGMAGLIKVLLSLKNSKIPPSIHFKNPNSNIDWKKVKVADKLIDWKKQSGKRRAGVSSFGFSGTLAHVILEEPPVNEKNHKLNKLTYHMLTLSAKSEKALKASIANMKNFLEETQESIADICYTTNISRGHMDFKFSIEAEKKEDFIKGLDEALNNPDKFSMYSSKKQHSANRNIAFLFTGQNSIYKDIAKTFYAQSQPFKEMLDLCNEKFREMLNIEIIDAMYDDNEDLIKNPVYSQPIIFSIECALTKVWESLGVKPKLVIGHSIGEYAAAYYGGLISLDDAVLMISHRSKMMDAIDLDGKMVGVLTNVENVKAAIHESGCQNVSIAAINAPENVTISGLGDEIDKVIEMIQIKQKVFINKLNIEHPYHSNLMIPYSQDYAENISEVNFENLKINMISTVTGRLENVDTLGKTTYWSEHLSKMVKFQEAIETARSMGITTFIEIGGDATLSGLASQCISDENIDCLPSLRQGVTDYKQLFQSLSSLVLRGVEIDWNSFYETYEKKKVSLPNYPFQRKKFLKELRSVVKESSNKKIEKEELLEIKGIDRVIEVDELSEVKFHKSEDIKGSKHVDEICLELKGIINLITGLEIDEIDSSVNLFSLGFDSLILMNFKKKIDSQYNLDISLNQFFEELNTVEKISRYIHENYKEINIAVGSVDEKLIESSVNISRIDGNFLNEFDNQINNIQHQLEQIRKLSRETISDKGLKNKVEQRSTPPNLNYSGWVLEKDSLTERQKRFIHDFLEKYNEKTEKSKAYATRYRYVLSDWINSLNFRTTLKELLYPVVSSRSEGCRFWDVDGNEYIDLAIGYGVHYFGHNPAFIKEAIKNQLDKGIELGPQSQLVGKVAELIKEFTKVERVGFCNTGTEAVMVALRIARAVRKKNKIVKFAGSYHGTFDTVLSSSDDQGEFPTSEGSTYGAIQDTVSLMYGSQESLEYIRQHQDEIAAVLVEPVQSRKPGFQPKEFLTRLRELTSRTGIILIFDEMITGFRIQQGGAQAYFGIEADMVTYGKIVGGGMPIGVVAGKGKYLDKIDGGNWLFGDESKPQNKAVIFAGTFCKNPLSMAAAYAVLSYMKEKGEALQNEVNEKTRDFVGRINEFFKTEKIPINVKNFGSQFKFESFGKYDPSLLPIELDLFFYLLMYKGIYTWERRTCCFCTEITEVDIRLVEEKIKETIYELREGGFFALQGDNDTRIPMSLAQKNLFTHILKDGQDPYNVVGVLEMKGKVNVDKIEQAFKKIIKRHDILRTRLYIEDEELLQDVVENVDFRVKVIKKEASENLEKVIDETITMFDLSKAPLFKVNLIEISNDEYALLIDIHHTIADGMSLNILAQEFMKAYCDVDIEPLAKQYKDYVEWEKKYLDSDKAKKSEAYWMENLSGEIGPVNIPVDSNATLINERTGNTVNMKIKEDLVVSLKKLAMKNESSLFMILVAAFNILLHKLSNDNEILIGTPVTTRGNGKFDDCIGMFTNTVILKNYVNENKTFQNFLHEVKQNLIDVYSHMEYPFNVLVNKLNVNREVNRNPIVNTMFIYENINERIFKIKDVEVKKYDYKGKATTFDFLFEILEENGEFNINLQYKGDLFHEETINRWGGYFESILYEVVENGKVLISDIQMLSGEEQNKLLVDFNDTFCEYPINKTIHQLFEEQVEKNSNKIAVEFEGQSLTYQELNDKSNLLARILRSEGVKSNSIVGIMVEKSLEMIIGIMGILKAGGAYLPIDPNYPKDRIKFMLNDSESKVLLSTKGLMDSIKFNGKVIDLLDNTIFEGEFSNVEKINQPSDLAYVIYTSGTTGQAKGVMIEHRQVNNFIHGITKETKLNSYRNILCITTICFDIFGFETLVPLTNGLKVIIASNEACVDSKKLARIIDENEIEVMQSTPSRLKILLENEEFQESMNNMQLVLVGGEEVTSSLFKKWNKNKDTKIYNVYGPTETTIWSTIKLLEQDGKITIGRPLSNTSVYVLNKNMQTPIGVEGELCIGGDGVARGYFNKLELTAERFVENPFEPGKKMYRTGDLARWLPNGEIEFLGRMDNQVKIRGFRIELGEIENRILQHNSVKEAAVVVKENKKDEKYICAYVVSDEELGDLNLRNYLSGSLPEYMIPAYFMKLEKMPLTPNGKLDRKMLPEPILEEILKEHEEPRNEVEEKLVNIWRELLEIEKIGTNDNFFDLGGHSLNAIILMGKIHKTFQVELLLKEIFELKTIQKLSDYIRSKETSRYVGINKIEKKAYYESSSAQKRMHILQEFSKHSTVYNMPVVFELEGEVHKQKIEETVQELIVRHEGLRTSFEVVEDEIVQKIAESCDFTLKEYRSDKEIDVVVKEFIQPFNLEKAPLFRVELVEIQGKIYLFIDMHHIILDGTSVNILIKDFTKLYNGEKLEDLHLQYKDFAVWQNTFLQSDEMKKQESYWINRFQGEIPVLNLPYDCERPAIQSHEGDCVHFEVGEELTTSLRNLTKETGTTMHMVLLSAFHILLSKCSGQEDIVIGIPIAGRSHADFQSIMGMFVNTLAIRNQSEGDMKYSEFLAGVKRTALEAYENQSYQFEALVEKLDIRRDASRNPLFDVMFSMGDSNGRDEERLENIVLKPIDNVSDISKFDLTLYVAEENDSLTCSIEYCTKLFKKETIESLCNYYIQVLKCIVKNEEIKIGEIEVITVEEKKQILYEFNNTRVDYPRDKTIQELFEKQVERIPNNTALVFNDEELTYKELNERANSLARVLRAKGVKADSIVGIMVEKSPEMIVGIMGILKAGGAYLPIDPNHPEERIEYTLKDSESKILLSKNNLVEGIEFEGEVIDLFNEELFSMDSSNLEKINKSDNLAYVIYTSGTTGNPKGAMIEHKSLVNRLNWMQKKYPLSAKDTILQKTTYTFDVSVWEILWWSLVGAKVCILSPNDEKDPMKIIEAIDRYEITTMHFVPSMLDVFLYCVEENITNIKLSSLRQVFSSGEALNFKQVSKFYKIFENEKKLINLYGPTEATIDVSYFDCSDDDRKVIPIGKPIDNTKLYVLKNNEVVPVGVIGELYIAGDGLARGYVNKKELTAEKFIDNPFEIGAKMYKTGDLARWLPDGNIEFLGRIDDQVKIRGYRIELGEIVNRLLQHENIKEAAAVVKEDKEKYICAYVVSKKNLEELNLKNYLKETLPEYMVPAYFIQVEEMPLTANGKLDRKALINLNIDTPLTEYEAPRNEVEEALVRIWSEVLGVKKIGINDNFFDNGGHSLKATILMSRIHKELNKEVPLKELFKYQTIKELSEYIEYLEEVLYSKIEKAEDKEYYEASSAQKRMYLLQEAHKDSTAYNMPSAIEIVGDFDFNKFKFALETLMKRHEILRTTFNMKDGVVFQKINKFEALDFNIDRIHVSSEGEVKSIYEKFIQPFDLKNETLIRLKVINLREKRNIFLIDMHHIISDGTTIEIMKKELNEIYSGQELDRLQLQYKDYSEWYKKRKESKNYKKQEEYWLKQFQREIPELNIPTDYERLEQRNFEGDSIHFEIDEEIIKALKEVVKETGGTMYMALLSCFAILLSKYSGQDDIIVGSPIAGRNHGDLENMLGMFVNTLAIRTMVDGDLSFREYIKSVRDKVLQDYTNQDYQFEELISSIKLERKINRNPIFDVLFVFQNIERCKSSHEELVFKEYMDITNVQKFDISLVANDSNGEISIDLEYSTSLFKRETIETMKQHFIEVMRHIAENPEIRIDDIKLTQNYGKVKEIQYATDFNF
ncbi:amino acid adenylation domain-containing protein [Bacillus thuringiensis]